MTFTTQAIVDGCMRRAPQQRFTVDECIFRVQQMFGEYGADWYMQAHGGS